MTSLTAWPPPRPGRPDHRDRPPDPTPHPDSPARRGGAAAGRCRGGGAATGPGRPAGGDQPAPRGPRSTRTLRAWLANRLRQQDVTSRRWHGTRKVVCSVFADSLAPGDASPSCGAAPTASRQRCQLAAHRPTVRRRDGRPIVGTGSTRWPLRCPTTAFAWPAPPTAGACSPTPPGSYGSVCDRPAGGGPGLNPVEDATAWERSLPPGGGHRPDGQCLCLE